MKKWHALLTLVVCTVVSISLSIQTWVQLPPDWSLFGIRVDFFGGNFLDRDILLALGMPAGAALAAIITNLVGVEGTEEEWERYKERRSAALGTGVLFLALLGTLVLFASYPQNPVFILILIIPFLLGVLVRGTGGGAGDTIERKHYDREGRYEGFSKTGSPRERNYYDREGRYKGYSKQYGDTVKYYDREGRLTGESKVS